MTVNARYVRIRRFKGMVYVRGHGEHSRLTQHEIVVSIYAGLIAEIQNDYTLRMLWREGYFIFLIGLLNRLVMYGVFVLFAFKAVIMFKNMAFNSFSLLLGYS